MNNLPSFVLEKKYFFPSFVSSAAYLCSLVLTQFNDSIISLIAIHKLEVVFLKNDKLDVNLTLNLCMNLY